MSLREIYQRYRDRVQFLNIYIREAHPVDGWWLGKGLPGLLLTWSKSRADRTSRDPRTLAERRKQAGSCQDSLDLGIPTLVDDLDDRVNKTYAAWPTRLYLVDRTGTVVYAGKPGPYGFRPSRLEQAIQQLLNNSQSHPEKN